MRAFKTACKQNCSHYVHKAQSAGAAKEKPQEHGGSLIFPMVFDLACDLLARNILEAVQLVTLLPEAVITML